jgi:hypothetical protein
MAALTTDAGRREGIRELVAEMALTAPDGFE